LDRRDAWFLEGDGDQIGAEPRTDRGLGGGVVKAMDPTEGVAPDGLQTNPWKQDVTKKISSSSGKKVCIGIDRKLVTGSTGVGHFHK